MTTALERKNFLRIVAAAGTGLALGLEIAPAAAAAEFSPVAWLRMAPDATTTVMINQAELGQGITTALSMCVADELDLPMAMVRFELAPAEVRYYNPAWRGMVTGSSKSVPSMSPLMRKAGATARAMLVSVAAQRWNVDPAACKTANAVVTGPAGQRAKYADLLVAAAALPVPAEVALKTPDRFTLIGKPQKRLDLVPKTNGKAIYGLDVKVPGMKYASIEKPWEIGAKVASYDATAAFKVPGVRAVYWVSSGIAVVADNTWSAFQGRKALVVSWTPGPNAGASTETIYAEARERVKGPGVVVQSIGDAKAALAAGKVIEAVYETPYLAHAPMEPMNTTADVRTDGVTIWSPTQGPTDSQKVAAKITGLPLEKIVVNSTYCGGGFGRRGEVDFIVDAVEVSKAHGTPIKLVWTREDDIRNDFYRAGTVHALAGTLAADGTVSAYKHTLAAESLTMRALPFLMKDGVDPMVLRGTANHGYTIPNQLIDNHILKVGLPVGFWRAPSANANTFATESFIDELAHAAGKDPVAFRLAILAPGSRQRVVLERVAQKAGWGKPLPPGHAQGVALNQWDEGWIAMVAEISMPNGKLKIHKMTASVDVGQPINPDGLDQQVPSAMIYGISAALGGKITFKNGQPVQKNFTDFTVLHMADSPVFVTDIVPSTGPPNGAGEIGTPGVAPALANAIFALTGKRVRKLPLNDNLA